MHSTVLRRGAAAVLMAMFIAATGCGGTSGSSGGKKDPASVLPATPAVAGQLEVGPGSKPGEAILEFAEKVDPSDRDLGKELIKSLEDDDGDDDSDVKYKRDVEPWLGERAAFAFDSFKGESGGGAAALESEDDDAARKFLKRSKKDDEAKSASYKGVDYAVDEDGESQGLVGGFVVAASDETHFKRAVDASKGRSLADDGQYKDAIERAPDNAAAIGVIQVGPFVDALADSGEVPKESIEQIRKTPGFEGASSVTMALLAESDKMTLDVAAKGVTDTPNPKDGPKLADVPGDAWLALAGPVMKGQIGKGFAQGLQQSGGAQAAQLVKQLGITDFLESVDGISMRLGGTSIFDINGELTLGGDDQAAAAKLVRRIQPQIKKAVGPRAKVRSSGASGFEIGTGPYVLDVQARDGDLKLSSGEQPKGKISDQQSYKSASDDLDGMTPSFFVDFAPIGKLVNGVPGEKNKDTQEVQRVLTGLGTLIGGSKLDGDTSHSQFVLTAR